MPTIALRKALYDECIRQGEKPAEFANEAVGRMLVEEHDAEVEA